ncbi:hypothetical protein [Ferrovibrio sp.]|uniref:hypothetical protein n=1 Tax=Ferrovibrio sp. TaxID=1917215 RepID=UPI0035199200
MLNRVPNEALVAAGLDLMQQAGQPLTRAPTKGRAMIYHLPDKRTVRVRTCNDHLLVVLADKDEAGAKLNVEGTDLVLIVMPETPRTPGAVVAYLVPAKVVAEAARETHKNWLAAGANTKGNNRTWNLWFDENGPEKANGFARRWSKYRLGGSSHTELSPSPIVNKPSGEKLGDVIASARQRIAAVAGVPIEAVRISVDLT